MRTTHGNLMAQRLGGASLIAAPLLLTTGWMVLLPTIGQGPTRAWTVSHYLLIGGYSALGPATLALRADGPPRTALLTTLGSAGVLLSLPTVFGQLTLDLVAAHGAATQQDMDAFFGRVFATPALAVPCYRVGPPLLFVSLALQALSLTRGQPTVRRFSSVLLAGILLVSGGQMRRAYRVVLLGHLLMLAGLAPLGWMRLCAADAAMPQRGATARSSAD